MVQPFKSSFDIEGHKISKAELKELQAIELALSGNSEDLKNIPPTLNALGRAYYITNLSNMNKATLSNLDKSLLEALANTQARLEVANEYLNEHGTLMHTKDSRGNEVVKEHPYVKQVKDMTEQLLKLSAKLGLSPVDRAGMSRSVSNEVVAQQNKKFNEYDNRLSDGEGWL